MAKWGVWLGVEYLSTNKHSKYKGSEAGMFKERHLVGRLGGYKVRATKGLSVVLDSEV